MTAPPTAIQRWGGGGYGYGYGPLASIAYTNLMMRANDASDSKQVVRDYITQHFFKYV
jgi:hypothetical protein